MGNKTAYYYLRKKSLNDYSISHYYLKDKAPFLNMMDMEEEERNRMIERLEATNKGKRAYGLRYPELRKLTEDKMRSLLIEKSIQPKRQNPVYFVLGKSDWFLHLNPDHRCIQFSINQLPKDQITITYPDSFISMGFMPQFGLDIDVRPYHNQLFEVDDLPSLIKQYGFPKDKVAYHNYHKSDFEIYIEVQYWGELKILQELSGFSI